MTSTTTLSVNSGLVLALALVLACTAFHADATNLSDAIAQTMESSSAMQSARYAQQAGREKGNQGDALLYPQVALTAGVTQIHAHAEAQLPAQFASFLQPDTSGSVRQAGLQLSQPLYNASLLASKNQLHHGSEIAELMWSASVQDVKLHVSEAYFSVLYAQEAVSVAQAAVDAYDLQRQRAQARFEVGKAQIIDVETSQAKQDEALAQLADAQNELDLRSAQFTALTNLNASNLSAINASSLSHFTQAENLSAWQQQAIKNNPTLQIRKIQYQISADELNKFSLQARPTLDLVAGYTTKSATGDLPILISAEHERNASIGLQLTIPLFTGGMLNSRQREAVAKHLQDEQDVETMQRDALIQVQEAFLSMKNGTLRIKALEKSLQSAQSALAATIIGRDAGLRVQLDVLDAQQRVYVAQLNLSKSRIDFLLNRLRLARSVGALDRDVIEAVDECLSR